MKSKFTYLKKVTLGCIFIATFFLPIKTSISNIGLIGLISTTILAFIIHGIGHKRRLLSFIFFSPTVFFIPLLWGIIYSPDSSEAINEVSKFALLALVPLFLFRKDLNSNLYKEYASKGILAGSVFSCVVLISLNLYNFSLTGHPFHWLLNNPFTGFNFLKPFEGLHPIYVGMYYNIAIAILLFGVVSIKPILRYIFLIVLFLGVLFLLSRINYLISFLLLGLWLIHNLSFKTFSLSLTLLLIIGAFSFSTVKKTYVYNKIVRGTTFDLTNNVGEYSTNNTLKSDSRLSRWLVAIEIVKSNPILGVGAGAENEVLLEKYKAYNMNNSIAHEYNAHNQFLGFFIRFGIIGFLGLCLYFVKNTISAIRHQHLLFLAFLTILFWTFMVENILDRNMGINFVALFGTLFYAEYLVVTQSKNQQKNASKA